MWITSVPKKRVLCMLGMLLFLTANFGVVLSTLSLLVSVDNGVLLLFASHAFKYVTLCAGMAQKGNSSLANGVMIFVRLGALENHPYLNVIILLLMADRLAQIFKNMEEGLRQLVLEDEVRDGARQGVLGRQEDLGESRQDQG